MKKILFLCLISLILVLTGCNIQVKSNNAYFISANMNNIQDTSIEVNVDYLMALNKFSYESASNILKNENNMYSPLSLCFALAMLAEITNNNSREQILNALNIENIEDLEQGSYGIFNKLCFKNDTGMLKLANSIWLRNNLEYNKETLKKLADRYYTSSYGVDFTDDDTPLLIGKWLSDNTGGKFNENNVGEFDDSTFIILFNTINFYCQWMNEMNKDNNVIDKFYSNSEFNVEYMRTSFANKYYKGTSFISADIKLKNDSKVVFILPDENVNVMDIANDPILLKDAITHEKTNSATINYYIPKFSFNSKFDLVESVKSMGIQFVFSGESDFSSIVDKKLMVSGINQNSFVSVNEKGVEAIAFTEILIFGSMNPPEEIDFKLNRPFIFSIVSQGVPMFIGVVTNPTEA